MISLYTALIDSGATCNLSHYGSYAMNSMRIEKAYKAWGSELTTEITPIEARLERFIDLSRNFIGSDVVNERKSEKLDMVLVYCEVETNDTDCRGNEPIYVGDDLVGLTTVGHGAILQVKVSLLPMCHRSWSRLDLFLKLKS